MANSDALDLTNIADRLRRAILGSMDAGVVRRTVDRYSELFDARSEKDRLGKSVEITRDFYELVTDFYEYGWGQSFHFAPIRYGEATRDALRRYEEWLGAKLNVKPGARVVDVGCGVGGPMRTIARSTGANIVGITISPYQIARGTKHNAKAGLSAQCEIREMDFNQMTFDSNSFDGAYSVESACHAADRRNPFGQIFRVLKPGSLYVGADWVMTSRYREGDVEHDRVKLGVEKGNGIAKLVSKQELDQCLKDVGFEILNTRDLAEEDDPRCPWYQPLDASISLAGFRNTRVGTALTHSMVTVLEKLKLSPEGLVKTHDVLRLAQEALVDAGRMKIFSPMYTWVARKPLAA